jgi:hypothetical protein
LAEPTNRRAKVGAMTLAIVAPCARDGDATWKVLGLALAGAADAGGGGIVAGGVLAASAALGASSATASTESPLPAIRGPIAGQGSWVVNAISPRGFAVAVDREVPAAWPTSIPRTPSPSRRSPSRDDVDPARSAEPAAPALLSFPAEKNAQFGADTPLGRPGQPGELAPIDLFLATAASRYISGEVIGATGGKPLH